MSILLRMSGVLLAAVAALVTLPQTAAAHVTVSADTVEPGHAAKVTFRVPNERDDAATVRLEVAFPTEAVLGHVSVAPVPGWTPSVRKRALATPVRTHDGELTEAVESVEWAGGQIRPGEFVEFAVTFGPIPHGQDRLVFKALQSYSDGQVVRWIEVPEAGRPEPEHPAAVLSLAGAPAAGTHTGGTDALARTFGVVGVITAFGALAAVAVLVIRSPRRRSVAPRPAAVREKARV